MTKLSAFFCKKHLAHTYVGRKKLFWHPKFIFGALGRHFFQTSVTFQKLRIFRKLRILGVDSILYLLTTYHYQTAVMKERLTLCSSKTYKWYYLFDTFFEYSSVLMAVITTVFEYVHTSEACDIEGASLLFTFSFCLPSSEIDYSVSRFSSETESRFVFFVKNKSNRNE